MFGRSDWMAHLPDNVSLSDISIPGTHDSATYPHMSGLTSYWRWAHLVAYRGSKFIQCQDLDLQQQLEFGVRFFDMRVKHDANFSLYHGSVSLGLDLAGAMDVIDQFLKDHPKETVLVCVKKEIGDGNSSLDTANALAAWFALRPGNLYNDCKIPLLKDVRGKAVLINRIAAAKNCGIYIDVPNNNIELKVNEQCDKSKLNFVTQDYYDPPHSKTIATKIEKIKQAYADYSTGAYDLRFAFMSASRPPDRWHWLGTTPGEFADTINLQVADFLRDHWAAPARWITILDYAGENGEILKEPVAEIISFNNFVSSSAATDRDTLKAGVELKRGERLISANKAWAAEFRADGNFSIIRQVDGWQICLSYSATRYADRVTLQTDGNLVVYNDKKPLAASDTDGKGDGCRLVMQNDGNLVIYDAADKAVWASLSSELSLK